MSSHECGELSYVSAISDIGGRGCCFQIEVGVDKQALRNSDSSLVCSELLNCKIETVSSQIGKCMIAHRRWDSGWKSSSNNSNNNNNNNNNKQTMREFSFSGGQVAKFEIYMGGQSYCGEGRVGGWAGRERIQI